MTYRFELCTKIKKLNKRIKTYNNVIRIIRRRNAESPTLIYVEARKNTCKEYKRILEEQLEILSRI